ncbi:MAG: hypothetical protein ABI370_03245 [Gammaproteobacteria bacterium]
MQNREGKFTQNLKDTKISDVLEKFRESEDINFTRLKKALHKLGILVIPVQINRFSYCATSFISILEKLERHGLFANAAAQTIVTMLFEVDPAHISTIGLGLCYFGSTDPIIQTVLYTEENINLLINHADKAQLIASGMQNLASAGLLQNENANKNRDALAENASIANSIGYVINYLKEASPNLATQANFELLLLHKDYIENIVSECGTGNLTQAKFNEILAQKVSNEEIIYRKQAKQIEETKTMMSSYVDDANFTKIIKKILCKNSLNLNKLYHYAFNLLRILSLIKNRSSLNANFQNNFDLLLSVEPEELYLIEHAYSIYKLNTTSDVRKMLYTQDNFEFFVTHLNLDCPLDYCLKELALSNLLENKNAKMNREALARMFRFAFAICNGLSKLRSYVPRIDSQNNFNLLIQYYQSSAKFLVFPEKMSQQEFEDMVSGRSKSNLSQLEASVDPNRFFTRTSNVIESNVIIDADMFMAAPTDADVVLEATIDADVLLEASIDADAPRSNLSIGNKWK